ncbi:hypothetical protein VNO77_39980 [Canavalia gladiata]|uniref:Uncharacterized protein n=1 Tax=Canavalia gladiata TaxID=3824 RepID=A0AAN9PR32_CANGL
MELLKLSKLKLQLQALVAEVRDLRDRERSATEQQHHLIQQKLKRNEEECGRKIQELQGELASIKEERQKLERKVNYLENDNVLLENKHKELKGTLNNLLQSREHFVHAYEVIVIVCDWRFCSLLLMLLRKPWFFSLINFVNGRRVPEFSITEIGEESTSQMKRSIETKDRMISVLSEKINSHLLLFDSIEKEVYCIKQIVDKVQNIVNDREEVMTSLKSKMDRISAFEKAFVENISDLRSRMENNEAELRRKDRVISELEAKLDAAKLRNNNQVLHYEVGSLRLVLQRVHNTVTNMNEEDKRLFSSILQPKEASVMDMKIADNCVPVYSVGLFQSISGSLQPTLSLITGTQSSDRKKSKVTPYLAVCAPSLPSIPQTNKKRTPGSLCMGLVCVLVQYQKESCLTKSSAYRYRL